MQYVSKAMQGGLTRQMLRLLKLYISLDNYMYLAFFSVYSAIIAMNTLMLAGLSFDVIG